MFLEQHKTEISEKEFTIINDVFSLIFIKCKLHICGFPLKKSPQFSPVL